MVKYPENEIKRQTSYIIDVDYGKPIAFKKSVEEAKLYIEKKPLRKAVFLSKTYKNGIEQVNYNATQNLKQGVLRQINTKGNENINEVFSLSLLGLKSALYLIDKDIVNDELAHQFLNLKDTKAIDFVVHRSKLELLEPEKYFINNEVEKSNNLQKQGINYKPNKVVLLRLHDNIHFPFSKDGYIQLVGQFGTIHAFNVFLAQYIAIKKTIGLEQILKNICEEQKQDFNDFIDPLEYENRKANFVYYNFLTKQITGADEKLIEQAKTELLQSFKSK